MTQSLNSQLKAIVTLLSDQDERTVDLVWKKLVDMGPEVLPSLEKARRNADPLAGERIDIMLEEIRQNNLEDLFQEYASGAEGELDLEEGVLLIARFRYPDLDPVAYRDELDRYAEEISRRLLDRSRAREVIHQINQFLYLELGFQGNTRNYYDPDNSYINRVLERRLGAPISLSVIYLLIAGRLSLPITGVGLPGHFMLKYQQKDSTLFLDPFNQGQALTRDECVRFLLGSGYEIQEGYFMPAKTRDILVRMLRNLVYIYNQLKDKSRAHQITRLIHILLAPVQE